MDDGARKVGKVSNSGEVESRVPRSQPPTPTSHPPRPVAHAGQALLETALVLPLLLLLAFGVVAVAEIGQARMGVTDVAREAARAGALTGDATQAVAAGQEVAQGVHLTNGSLRIAVDEGGYVRGGKVTATVQYTVSFDNLPLLGWASVTVGATHVEPIDPYASRW